MLVQPPANIVNGLGQKEHESGLRHASRLTWHSHVNDEWRSHKEHFRPLANDRHKTAHSGPAVDDITSSFQQARYPSWRPGPRKLGMKHLALFEIPDCCFLYRNSSKILCWMILVSVNGFPSFTSYNNHEYVHDQECREGCCLLASGIN